MRHTTQKERGKQTERQHEMMLYDKTLAQRHNQLTSLAAQQTINNKYHSVLQLLRPIL